MNANGMARGYMAQGMDETSFLNHVLNAMERVLDEWKYDVKVTLNENIGDIYNIVFSKSDSNYIVSLSNDYTRRLQTESPYALDRFLWEELKEVGITIRGNHYLNTVIKKK